MLRITNKIYLEALAHPSYTGFAWEETLLTILYCGNMYLLEWVGVTYPGSRPIRPTVEVWAGVA